MTRVTLLVFLLLCCGNIFSQNLDGEWKGFYWDNSRISTKGIPITIHLYKTNDSTYTGQITNTLQIHREYDTSVCEVICHLKGRNLIKIEEIKFIQRPSFEITHTSCLQTMKLKYITTKKRLKLSGKWVTDNKCGYGQITVKKNN